MKKELGDRREKRRIARGQRHDDQFALLALHPLDGVGDDLDPKAGDDPTLYGWRAAAEATMLGLPDVNRAVLRALAGAKQLD